MSAPEFELRDRVAIVTGASRSIGRATALALAEAGADVVLDSRSLRAVERVAGEVRAAAGRRALPVECDVGDAEAVEALVATCVGELGAPDIVVANAGVFQEWGPTAELSPEEWSEVVAVDLTGVMLTCRSVVRAMLAEGRAGSIVTVSSIAGLVGIPGAAAYTASKSGVVGLVRALAAEWAEHGIRVNAVAPGFVVRDQDPWRERPEELADLVGRIPMARRGEPREVALAVLFLASDAASFVTGATLPVDGGWVAV
jgi:NAD(P)-dependent dehydrogenase (short-subunit alcohol dehydrogenase family)